MAVSEDYLLKIIRAVRVNRSDEIEAELIDIIEECRLDLTSLGVATEFANDEADAVILGAVRSFARWKFGLGSAESAQNKEDYMLQRDELRRREYYCTSPTV